MRVVLLAALSFLTAISPLAHGADAGVPAFQVTAPNGEQSILIGSMHVPHPGLRQPSPRVLDNARVLVIEHTTADEKPDFTLAPEVLAALLDGRDVRAPWAEFITKQHLAAIQARLACNPTTAINTDTLEMLLKLRSARMMATLAYVPCSPAGAFSRDAILEKGAATLGLPIRTLESQAEVEQRRRSLGDQAFVASLKAAVATDIEALYAQMVDALNTGDFDLVATIAARGLDSELESRQYHQVMVRDRNQAWMPALRPALDAGRAVVVVGAAHLPGPDGLVTMLRQAGYSVQRTSLQAERSRPVVHELTEKKRERVTFSVIAGKPEGQARTPATAD
jgi:uncharacterized protein YbaP (TraB family)